VASPVSILFALAEIEASGFGLAESQRVEASARLYRVELPERQHGAIARARQYRLEVPERGHRVEVEPRIYEVSA
jgi:hypothetical protein